MLHVVAARIRKVFQKLIGSSRILLFYSCLPDKRLVVYPNQRQVVCSPCLTDKVILIIMFISPPTTKVTA
jgi:hypothetical protein